MPAPRYLDAVRRQAPKDVVPQKRGGFGRGSPNQVTTASAAGQTSTALPHNQRLIFAFASAIGERVVVQVKNGTVFEGTLHGPVLGSKNIHITLKNARKLADGNKGDEMGKTHETLVIPANEFVQLKAEGIPLPSPEPTQRSNQQAVNDASSKAGSERAEEKDYEVEDVRDENDMSGYMGDIERSKATQKSTERTLVAWNSGGDEQDDVVLEGNVSDWCQFSDKANAGVETTFDMDAYTSKLDVNRSRYTKEEADRIASEIEGESQSRSVGAVNDSGVADKEEEEKKILSTAHAEPILTKKPLSWADAVKGRSPVVASQPVKQPGSRTEYKHPDIEMQQRPSSDAAHQSTISPDASIVQPVATPAVANGSHAACSDKTDRGHQNSETTFMSTADRTESSSHVQRKEPQVVFGDVSYPLSSCVQLSSAGERTAGFQDVTEEPAMDNASSPSFHREATWGSLRTTESMSVQTQHNDAVDTDPPVQKEEAAVNNTVSPVYSKTEQKKPTSTVVPGISFKDILKANLPSSAPKPQLPSRQRISHVQTKSSSNVTEASTEYVVQSPRSKSFSGKLISNARSGNVHSDAKRSLPSEEHLLSPMTMPHPMMYPSHMVPGSSGAMPHPMPPGPYSEMHHGSVPASMHYGGYMPPPIVDPSHSDTMPPMPPKGQYPPSHQTIPAESGNREEMESEKSARGRGRFQLNPRAEAYKPVTQVEGSVQPSTPQSPSAFGPPQMGGEYENNAHRPGELASPRAPPHPQVAMQPQTPKGMPNAADGQPPEYKGPPPHPGARPAFVAPSNVVTPWPSFPGTGVWHSTLGPPRPGGPPGAMINGYMPPGMPPPYPVMMPGPVPYTGGMQDPMWRGPPMPRGMPDQQGLAMMWQNYYSHVVPSNQRVYNPAKFQGGPGPIARPGRGHRRPYNANSNQTTPNFSPQVPDTQPNGEMP